MDGQGSNWLLLQRRMCSCSGDSRSPRHEGQSKLVGLAVTFGFFFSAERMVGDDAGGCDECSLTSQAPSKMANVGVSRKGEIIVYGKQCYR